MQKMQDFTNMGEMKMSKYRGIRKGLLSAAAVIAAAVMLGGCGNEVPEKAVPDNYAYEPITVEPLNMEKNVKTVASFNDGKIRFKEAYIGTMSGHTSYGNYVEDSSGFIVNYSFNNTSGANTCMRDLAGELRAYQNGIELSEVSFGDYDERTDILPGATVELTKVFETNNFSDPVELISSVNVWNEYTLEWNDVFTYHSIMTPITEICYSKEDVPYSFEIKGAGFTDSGKIVVDSTFTNTSDSPATPASIYAVLAYQGTKQLSVSSESQDNEGYLLKWFKAEPNETVSLSTTFVLDNSSDSVMVYLTDPETGDVFSEKIYSR